MTKLLVEVDIGFETTELPIAYRPATPEEIKAAHGKCGTCKHFNEDWNQCYHEDHPDDLYVNPDTDYCNRHEPKET